jgi:hypothetical protein
MQVLPHFCRGFLHASGLLTVSQTFAQRKHHFRRLPESRAAVSSIPGSAVVLVFRSEVVDNDRPNVNALPLPLRRMQAHDADRTSSVTTFRRSMLRHHE